MAHKTKFTTADFVILQVAEKEKIASFFNKREFFLLLQNLHQYLLYVDAN